MLARLHQRGDTLIEVLFAITVFSLIIVGSLSIMNQGLAAAQRSNEITQVRQQIDGQAEMIRFLHDSYVAAYKPGVSSTTLTGPARQWALIMENTTVAQASEYSTAVTCPTIRDEAFIVNPKTATFVSRSTMPTLFSTNTETYAKLIYDPGTGNFVGSQRLWVEAVRSVASADVYEQTAGYVDFHIRACWETLGMSNAMNLGTIVRLYEPRN